MKYFLLTAIVLIAPKTFSMDVSINAYPAGWYRLTPALMSASSPTFKEALLAECFSTVPIDKSRTCWIDEDRIKDSSHVILLRKADGASAKKQGEDFLAERGFGGLKSIIWGINRAGRRDIIRMSSLKGIVPPVVYIRATAEAFEELNWICPHLTQPDVPNF